MIRFSNKQLIKNFGLTKVAVTPVGLTIHASPHMHDDSLQRLVNSKRYKELPQGREVTKSGTVPMLVPKKLQYVKKDTFMFPVNTGDKICYFKCQKITNKQVRVIDANIIHNCVPTCIVYIYEDFPYSFTQKTSNMATAKKAAPKKKVAVKAKAKKEGPGKIEQIIALHKQGLSNKEIEAKGFNYTTISIQVGKYKRAKAEAKAGKKKAA